MDLSIICDMVSQSLFFEGWLDMRIYIKPTTTTRFLALIFLFTFFLGVWSCRHALDMNKVTERQIGIHDKVYISSLVNRIDYENKQVAVSTIDENMVEVVFEASDEMLDFLKENSGEGWILPVTFFYGGKFSKDYLYTKSTLVFVAGWKVKPVSVLVFGKR